MASSEMQSQADAQQVRPEATPDSDDVETNADVPADAMNVDEPPRTEDVGTPDGSDHLIQRTAVYRMFKFEKKASRSWPAFTRDSTASMMLYSPTEQFYAERLCQYNRHLIVRGSRADSLDEMWMIADCVEARSIWTVVDLMAGSVTLSRGGTCYARETSINRRATIAAARVYLEKMFISPPSSDSDVSWKHTYQTAHTFAKVYVTTSSWYAHRVNAATFDGVPVWPLVYCLLRCGDLFSATRVLRNCHDNSALIRALTFVRDHGHYADLMIYDWSAAAVARNPAVDPFKRVVYALLADFDENARYPDVLKTPEDYLWLWLCQLRTGPTVNIMYHAIQKAVHNEFEVKYGDVCPVSYFDLLFLTGQFERAVQFMFNQPKYRVHAVHVAIVLSELGLLYLSKDPDGPISSYEADGRTILNLPRIMKMYCAKFEKYDVEMAVNYYYCLRHIKSQGTTLFVLCVADLIVETEECEKVFGYVKPDGNKQNGILDLFVLSDKVKMDIIKTTAKLFEQKCNFKMMSKVLYELVGENDKMLEQTD